MIKSLIRVFLNINFLKSGFSIVYIHIHIVLYVQWFYSCYAIQLGSRYSEGFGVHTSLNVKRFLYRWQIINTLFHQILFECRQEKHNTKL